MNKILTLTKVFLKTSFQLKFQSNSENKSKKIMAQIGYGILILYLMGIFAFLSYQLIQALQAFGQETLFIGIFLLAILALVVIQTVFSAINLFYFSKDIEHILPLPIKPVELLIAKLNVLLISEYMIEMVFGLVPMILYGILTGAGILYYIISVLVLLLLPIAPIVLITLVIMIIMRFSNLVKYKERFQLFINIAIIGIVIGTQFFLAPNTAQEVSQEEMLITMTKANGMVDMIGNYFLTLKPGIQAIIHSNTVNCVPYFLQLIGITAATLLIFVLIGKKLYLKGLVGSTGSATKRTKKIEKYYKKREIGLSYVIKEFKNLIRNPIYFIQCILPSLLMPIIFIVPVFAAGGEEMNSLIQSLEIQNSLGICIILAVISFLYMMNFIAITAISRDGENAKFVKQIPVSLYDQFIYKIVPNVFMNLFPSIIVLGIVYYLFSVSIWHIITIFLLSFLINWIQSILMFMVDLKRPKLIWNTEYAVVKQNMNMIFEFIFAFFSMLVLGIIGFLLKEISYFVTILILCAILDIVLLLLNKYIKNNQVKLFEKIN